VACVRLGGCHCNRMSHFNQKSIRRRPSLKGSNVVWKTLWCALSRSGSFSDLGARSCEVRNYAAMNGHRQGRTGMFRKVPKPP